MGRQARWAALALGGSALLVGAYASALLATAGIVVSALALAALTLRAQVLDPRLQAPFRWLVRALGVGVVAGLLTLVEDLVSTPTYLSLGDVVGLGYIPLTVAGLLAIPLEGRRRGFRARAVSDGLVAASSLLFLLEPLLDHAHRLHSAGFTGLVAVAYPVGGVFVVAAALTALARCAEGIRPVVRWLALGVLLLSLADLAYAVAPDAAPGLRRAVFQVGLLLLFGSAMPRRPLLTGRGPREVSPTLGSLPFLPFAGAVLFSGTLVVTGRGLEPDQLFFGIAVALCLVLRQVAGGRDKDRLVRELGRRESLLQQELRVDRLTGAANRLGLEEAVQRRLSSGDPFFLVLLDLDDFKVINDNHGHSVGDEVLRQVAHRLRTGIRSGDVVARLGGDEFVLLVAGSPRDLEVVSQRVVASLEPPVVIEDRRFRVSASIGVVGSDKGDSAERLLADADGAMYEAKADRSSSSVVRLDQEGRSLVAMRSKVREEIAHPDLSQFSVRYQPLVHLASGRVTALEALLRWNHPVHGAIPPDLFIPLAEQCGSIHRLGDLVLRTAIADLAALSRTGTDQRLQVCINVSPRQLAAPGFPPRLDHLLEAHGLKANRIVVEITEQAFEADLTPIRSTVQALRASGVSIAVDDFGTGYSSLRYLQHLDLDVLKIDRQFIEGVESSVAQRHLVSGITALARQLNLKIVAEGIETPEQLAFVDGLGCELGQGYLFSPPLPYDELQALLGVPAVPRVPGPRSAQDNVSYVTDGT